MLFAQFKKISSPKIFKLKNLSINMADKNIIYKHKSHGAIYGLGFIGSAVYFLSSASGFWAVVLGLLKSAVWPAILVFELLKHVAA